MGKSKKSILNALAALLQMAVTSIVGLVLNKAIIDLYGSDYNGINSTISQIIAILMVLEGGFSLASNVALFEPFEKKDFITINGILSATRKRFAVIGWISLVLGIIVSFIYPFTITTSMPKWLVTALSFTALIPASFNLGFSMKYRVMVLTDQKEYVLSIITTLTYLIGNGISILLMYSGCSILTARIAIMISLIVNSFFIAIFCKKVYPFIEYKEKPLSEKIKGTKNVIILKLSSALYSSVPIIAISTIPKEGTLLASVYAVYSSIVSAVKNCIFSVTNAPRLAFGALFAEGRSDDAKKYYNIYEMLSCMAVSVIIGTTCLLLLPFIGIYTAGVDDIKYRDMYLGIIMIVTVIIEIIHIPSGQIIQMKGEFDVAKKIQLIACAVLVVLMIYGRIFDGLYGVVLAIMMAAFVLAVLEIGYTSMRIFNRKWVEIFKNIIPCFIVCTISMIIGFSDVIKLNGYFSFIFSGFVLVLILSMVTITLYWIFNRCYVIELFQIVKGYWKNFKWGKI